MTEAVGGDLNSALLGHYQVEALIGRGGMGEVYRARSTTLGRAVAIKVLPAHLVENAERLARFVQEARAASALNHPHVITIYEIGSAALSREGSTESQSVHYIAMELVAGETLRTLIDQRRLDTRRTLEIFTQAAEALAAAHGSEVLTCQRENSIKAFQCASGLQLAPCVTRLIGR
jgi:eukaryotic-like serine/threonine-protein kinase